MKKFNYQAKDSASGKIVKATVQADTENSAAKLLIEQGFSPLKIEEADTSGSFIDHVLQRVTTKDKVVFTRQLATLIGAGLPLSQSLRTVSEQTENKALRSIVDEIIADVEGGKSLHDSFARHPEVFDKVYLALIKAGEASGTLDGSLKRIANQQEKDAAVMSKIKGALTYPLIVVTVIIGVLVFMLMTVVPQVEKLYDDLNKSLPFLTQSLVTTADFVAAFWWLVLIILGIGFYFLRQYLKTDSGIKAMDSFKLNMPLFGGLFRKLYMSRFCHTGQTLLTTGVPMLEMLKITSGAVGNTIVGKSLSNTAEKVKGGKALSEAIAPEEYILPLVPQMIKIGEQSGKMDEMMGKAAQVYEEELDAQIAAISTLIEPLLMVILAVVAGGMVGAILFPIYSLVNTIQV